MLKITTLFILALVTTPPVFSASFDCAKASTKVEKLICSNTELSKLDEDLSKAYLEAKEKSSDKQSFKKEQRDWLIKRNKCADLKCVMHKYIKRTNLLKTANGCAGKNIISQLPKELDEMIPLGMGVESIAASTLNAKGIKLIAAIANPIWSFNYCGGVAPKHDTDARELFVWRMKEGNWKQVARSNKVLYSIMTSGEVNTSINLRGNNIHINNSSSTSPRLIRAWHDNYELTYNSDNDQVSLIKWGASSLDYRLSFWADKNQIKQYEEASKKYGNNISWDIGYEGEVNFSSRVGTVDVYKFALPIQKGVIFQVPHGPIILDAFKGESFYRLPYVPESIGEPFR